MNQNDGVKARRRPLPALLHKKPKRGRHTPPAKIGKFSCLGVKGLGEPVMIHISHPKLVTAHIALVRRQNRRITLPAFDRPRLKAKKELVVKAVTRVPLDHNTFRRDKKIYQRRRIKINGRHYPFINRQTKNRRLQLFKIRLVGINKSGKPGKVKIKIGPKMNRRSVRLREPGRAGGMVYLAFFEFVALGNRQRKSIGGENGGRSKEQKKYQDEKVSYFINDRGQFRTPLESPDGKPTKEGRSGVKENVRQTGIAAGDKRLVNFVRHRIPHRQRKREK